MVWTDHHLKYARRAKLYQFGESLLDKGTGNKQWNERGKGEIKILRYPVQPASDPACRDTNILCYVFVHADTVNINESERS